MCLGAFAFQQDHLQRFEAWEFDDVHKRVLEAGGHGYSEKTENWEKIQNNYNYWNSPLHGTLNHNW